MDEPHPADCLNCGQPIAAQARFCASCGQRTDTARLSFADLVRDLMHTFVNIERGPLAFAWALATRPGRIAREYVDGKRRRHYGPFATLAVLVGLTALAVNASGFQVLSHDGLPSGPTALLQRHFNLLLLVQLPLLGAICALLFRTDRLTLPEHMVLVAYTLGVRAVVVALSIPFAYFGSVGAPRIEHVYVFWAVWYLYFGWSASQFYAGPRVSSGARGVLAAMFGHLAILALMTAGNGFYELLRG
jgi:hypothetical protein